MKQEDKELLLKDISARLPYKTIVKCIVEDGEFDTYLDCYNLMELTECFEGFGIREITFTPYLRPMSSMTKEERYRFLNYFDCCDEEFYHVIDWLNVNHFDYRGLIEKGLALEAPKDMYLTEKEKPAIPKTVEEAFPILDDVISDEDKKYLKDILDEDEIKQKALSLHFSLGRWIRNNWGLWEEQENELKKLLSQKGFTHPDDMSNYIINEYIKYLNHTDY